MAVTFLPARFREQYPAFADTTRFPDTVLTACFNQGVCYIPNKETRCLDGPCLEQALLLLTAHICQLRNDTENGKGNGIVTSASVGGVSVSVAPPPFGSSQWDWWLNNSPYGAQLNAFLDGLSVGGFYIGGRCERRAFRKVGGAF